MTLPALHSALKPHASQAHRVAVLSIQMIDTKRQGEKTLDERERVVFKEMSLKTSTVVQQCDLRRDRL